MAHRLFLTLLFAASGTARALTLQEAIATANARSLEAQRSVLAAEAAQIDVDVARRGGDPTLTLSANAGVKYAKKTAVNPASFEEVQKSHAYGAQASYTLLDFGRNAAKVKQAEMALRVESLSKDEVLEKLFWSVTRAYYSIVAAERLLVITKEQVGVSEARLATQQRNYREGLRPESDVVTAEVDVGRARIAAQNAAFDAQTARLKLAQLINPPTASAPTGGVTGEVPLKGVATSLPAEWDAFATNLKGTTESAVQKRLDAQREALGVDQEAIDATTKPTLKATVGAEYGNAGADFTPMRPAASGSLSLTWDVPWNGMTRLQESRLAVRRRDIDVQDAVEVETRLTSEREALQQLSVAKAQYDALEAQLGLAKRQQKLVNDRYRAGNASALDVSVAEAAVLTVQLDRARLGNIVAQGLLSLAEARGVRDVGQLSRI